MKSYTQKTKCYGIPKEIENTYNYLYYSFKKANAFYSLLYDKFIKDYNKEAFCNLCYIAIYNSGECRNVGKLGACKAITGRVGNYTQKRTNASRKIDT